MEVFCFDMTLFQLVEEQQRGPGFLFHDSHLFDGVDGRQIASALSFGQAVARRFGAQYIVAMNSDIFDGLPLPPDVDPQEVVLPVRLSDKTDSGGLFGFSFA